MKVTTIHTLETHKRLCNLY